MSSEDSSRQARAKSRRIRSRIRKTELSSQDDPNPLRGAEAVTLVLHLSREAWALSGGDEPEYDREEIPCRFVPGTKT